MALDIEFIRNQVNNMFIEKKDYDSRAKIILLDFFIRISNKLDFSEEDLVKTIEQYKSKIDKISFYNIGSSNYICPKSNEIIFDKQTADNLDENNVQNFLQASIKGNSQVLFGDLNWCKYNNIYSNSYDMITLNSFYDSSNDLNSNIISMIAASFNIEEKNIPFLYKNLSNHSLYGNLISDKSFYNNSSIIFFNILENINKLLEGKNAKEIYKAIFGSCVLNLNLIASKSNYNNPQLAQNYRKLIDTFKKYKDNLGIEDSELDIVSLNLNNWKINTNDILSNLEQQYKNIEIPNKSNHENNEASFGLTQEEIITEHKKYVTKEFPTQADIEKKVNQLIQNKSYPKEFHNLLLEFFKRNSEEFNWDTETLDKKLANLGKAINTFEYVPKNHLKNIDIGFIALCNPSDNNILLTSNLFKSNLQTSRIVMHELTHAISTTYYNDIEVEEFIEPEKSEYFDTISGLNELITEASTIKISGINPYKDKFASTYNFDFTYQNFTGILSMISSSLGITESEFLKIANNGIHTLKDTFDLKYPNLNIGEKIDKLSNDLTHFVGTTQEIIMKDKASNSYSDIYNILNEIYTQRIAIEKNNPDFDPIKARYDEYKLNKNFLICKKNIGLPEKFLSEKIDNYDSIKQKASINPEETKYFQEIGKSTQEEITIRNNSELKKCGAEIKSFKKNFKFKNHFLEKILLMIKRKSIKSLIAPKEKLIPPKKPSQELTTYKEFQTTFEDRIHVDINESQISKTNQPNSQVSQTKTNSHLQDDDNRIQ